MESDSSPAPFIILVIMGFIMGIFVGLSIGRGYVRNQAVEAGAGRYEADPKTGNVNLVYHTGKE